ncbi:MAG TPA: Gfo/Idh/MocA family oxidoreductase [Bryobacteraceae bacterium]|nr:Gfo/Idh/MocA family oxidoreductase [Bryobacteraceae bacterium]
MKNPLEITRRDFVAAGGTALAASAAPFSASAAPRRMRIAQVGTGSRGLHWGADLIASYAGQVEMVGLCDINPKRVLAAKEIMRAQCPTFVDFDKMIKETAPDVVLVTTTDAAHYTYIIRAMELGRDVITEKPLCTDEEQLQAILDAEKKYGRKLTVAFNARHFPEARKIKELLLEKAIGDVISVDYQEYLDTNHGASYFRRWHRLKEYSGTLTVTKSCHHFDQVNWWLEAVPESVVAWGDLKFYGKNNSFRGVRCRGCQHQQRCQFYWDVTKVHRSMQLYVGAESEDGYFIDGCVWRQDVNIQDTFTVMTRYSGGARLTYTANSFLPYEGQEIAINGTKGRIDFNMYAAPGYPDHQLRLTRMFGKSELIQVQQREGGHGGADPGVRDLIFRDSGAPDPLKLKAGSLAGAYSSLVGIAAYRSMERGGQTVQIRDLVKL